MYQCGARDCGTVGDGRRSLCFLLSQSLLCRRTLQSSTPPSARRSSLTILPAVPASPPCKMYIRRTAPQRFLCHHFASSLIHLTLPSFFHSLQHTHTHTLALTHADLFILCTLCLAGTPPACGVTTPPLPLIFLLLLLLSPPSHRLGSFALSSFPESCQSEAGCCVGLVGAGGVRHGRRRADDTRGVRVGGGVRKREC